MSRQKHLVLVSEPPAGASLSAEAVQEAHALMRACVAAEARADAAAGLRILTAVPAQAQRAGPTADTLDAASLAEQPDVDGVLCRCGGGGAAASGSVAAAVALAQIQAAAPRVLRVAGLGSRGRL